MWVVWIIVGLVVVVGIPFTLWWWKTADQWADAEEKRFKPLREERERVVVQSDRELPGDKQSDPETKR